MKRISEILTEYVIKSGAAAPESYVVYQYGFQVGLEMLCSFMICCFMAILLHMILQFIIFTIIFMLLRTYAGGIHLESFLSCLVCSVSVQTLVFIIQKFLILPLFVCWIFILFCSAVIVMKAPVDSRNRELTYNEKKLYKKTTKRIVYAIILFSIILSISENNRLVFLVALILFAIMISQYMGEVKNKIVNEEK